MSFSLVVAYDKNRVIGCNGTMPWDLPADMKIFVRRTMHHPVVMGRKTWQSLRRQPLPGRRNIVLSRDSAFTAPLAEVERTLEKIAAEFTNHGECMVVGGGEIYRIFLPQATRIYLSEIEGEFPGNVWFPKLNPEQWCEVSRVTVPKSDQNAFPFSSVILERRRTNGS